MKDKQGVLFSNLFRRPVAAVFDSPQSSSDGGSVLLKACDQALGLTEALACWLRDRRQPGKVVHGVRELLARSWKRRRRVVMQAGLALQAGRKPKANPRFVVTNIQGGARRIYRRITCQRGEVENRIKELKAGVEMDRASCSRFDANQFRVLLSAAAYALLQELRWRARETCFARTQAAGLRLSLLKLGVWVRSPFMNSSG